MQGRKAKRRRRKGLSEDAWDLIGACMVVLFVPVMLIIVEIARCFV